MEHFKPKERSNPALLVRTRTTMGNNFVSFIADHDAFEAFVHHDVLQLIYHKAESAAPNETIGLLAGRVCRDRNGPYTIVQAADVAIGEEVEATPGHVRISSEGHARLRARLEGSYPALEIVGWYHSHPSYKAQFSPEDKNEQLTWNDPNHVGIVVSGLQDSDIFGVYRGPKATRLRPKKHLLRSEFEAGKAVAPVRHIDGESQPTKPVGENAIHYAATFRHPMQRPLPPDKLVSGSGKTAAHLPWLLILMAVGIIGTTIWLNSRMQAMEVRLAGLIKSNSIPPASVTVPPATQTPPGTAPDENAPQAGETTVIKNTVQSEQPAKSPATKSPPAAAVATGGSRTKTDTRRKVVPKKNVTNTAAPPKASAAVSPNKATTNTKTPAAPPAKTSKPAASASPSQKP